MRFLGFFLPILFAGCGAIGEMIQHAGEPTAKTESTTDKSIEEYQLEPYNGPKARVAVYQFADQTPKAEGLLRRVPGLSVVHAPDRQWHGRHAQRRAASIKPVHRF